LELVVQAEALTDSLAPTEALHNFHQSSPWVAVEVVLEATLD
jgi:hypothetical protein